MLGRRGISEANEGIEVSKGTANTAALKAEDRLLKSKESLIDEHIAIDFGSPSNIRVLINRDHPATI